jgi:transcription elongation factor Elf1
MESGQDGEQMKVKKTDKLRKVESIRTPPSLSSTPTELSRPIDVYTDWIDACAEAQNPAKVARLDPEADDGDDAELQHAYDERREEEALDNTLDDDDGARDDDED